MLDLLEISKRIQDKAVIKSVCIYFTVLEKLTVCLFYHYGKTLCLS